MAKVLAITLARGGSKGIKNKNIAILHGKPLIEYTITEAMKSRLVTDYIVSTDSKAIASCAKSLGANVPFMRPEELATDTATSADALVHATLACEELYKTRYDLVVELMCTNPFKTVTDIDSCIDIALTKGCDSVIGVTRVEEFHPARLKRLEDGYIKDFCVEEKSSRRQDLRPYAYIRNGSIYAINRDRLVNDNYRFGGENSIGFEMPWDRSINVDSRFDMICAEALLAEKQNKS